MSKGDVVVLGITGHIGRAAALAFAAAGWSVRGMARREVPPLPGVTFERGDAASLADLRRVIGPADIVVNALNLPYHQWDLGRFEAQMARVITAMGSSGKTVLFPGNNYNFSAGDRLVTPDLPQHPQTPRGGIRVRLEQMLAAAAGRGDIQAIVLRAGDFYGPGSHGDWFEQGVLSAVRKGVVQRLGPPAVGHSWAYLPDLGRAFESLAALRRSLGAFERVHFAGHFVTHAQLTDAIRAAAPVPLKVKDFPHWIMPLLGLGSPLLRELGKMSYLWRHTMELSDPRLTDLLGPQFGTPFADAIAATIAPYFAAVSASKTPATAHA